MVYRKIFVYMICGFLIFVAGFCCSYFFMGYGHGKYAGRHEVIKYLSEEIEKNFGKVTGQSIKEYEVIGSIPFKGPMALVIILENGVKTIKIDYYESK